MEPEAARDMSANGADELMQKRAPDWPPGMSREHWRRLWAAADLHPVDPGALGQYVALRLRTNAAEAAGIFPAVAAHLDTHCASCLSAMKELESFLASES